MGARPPAGAFTLLLAATLALARPPVAPAQEPVPPRCGPGVHVGETSGAVAFPGGDVFCPLIADPKGEASFLALQRGDFPILTEADNDTDLGSVGLADAFPFVRWNGSDSGE